MIEVNEGILFILYCFRMNIINFIIVLFFKKKKIFINIIFLNYIIKVFYLIKYRVIVRIKLYCYGFVKFNFFIF